VSDEFSARTGVHSQDAAEPARSIDQSRRAASRGARLVVWREKSLGVDPQRDPVGAQLTTLARQEHIYLVVGYQVLTAHDQRNEATVISPDGHYLGVYAKRHPAIMFADDRTSLTAGAMPVYRTPLGRLATIICFDLDYTDTARAPPHAAVHKSSPSLLGPARKRNQALRPARLPGDREPPHRDQSRYRVRLRDHRPLGKHHHQGRHPLGSRATLVAAVSIGTGHTPSSRSEISGVGSSSPAPAP
jgi:apolipoprotein N-acyltransferase